MRGYKSCKINKRGGGNKCGWGFKVVKSINKIHKKGWILKKIKDVEIGDNCARRGAKSEKTISATPHLLERWE